MKIRNLILASIVMICSAISVSASNETEKTGTIINTSVINEDTTLKRSESPYIIKNDLTINNNLRIEAGTELIVDEGKQIIVKDAIISEEYGSVFNKYGAIKITSDTTWKGLVIEPNGSIQGYFDISNAEVGLTSKAKYNYTSRTLEHITLHDNTIGFKALGIVTDDSLESWVYHSQLMNCGIYNNEIGAVLDCKNFDFIWCRVEGNDIGVKVLEPTADIEYSYFSNNKNYGIVYEVDDGIDIECTANSFYNNGKNICVPNNSKIDTFHTYFKDMYKMYEVMDSIVAEDKDSLDIDNEYAILENDRLDYLKKAGSIGVSEHIQYNELNKAISFTYDIWLGRIGPVDFEALIILYKDNEIVKIQPVDMSKFPILSEVVQIPDGADTMKIFYWDSFKNLVPIRNVRTIDLTEAQ